MNSTEQRKTSTEQRQKRFGLLAAAIFTVLGVVFLLFWIYNVMILQKGEADFSDQATLPLTILMIIAGLAGYYLIRRDRLVAGLWMIFGVVLIPPVVVVLVLANVYSIVLAYIVIFAFISITWVFPKSSRRSAIIATAATVLVATGIQIWNPSFRVTSENLAGFAPYMIVLGSLGFLAFSIRQAIIGNLLTKFVVAFSVIAVVIVGFLGSLTLSATRTNMTEEVGDNLSELAGAHGNEIAIALNRELDILKTLSLNENIQNAALLADQTSQLSPIEIDRLDQQWRAADAANNDSDPLVASVLQNLLSSELRSVRAQFPQHVEIFLTGIQGINIASTNRTSDYLQADEAWWQIAYNDGIYIGQPEYDASSKTIAIIMAVAVRQGRTGNVVGVLRTTVNFTTLTKSLRAALFGRTGRAVILLPDGKQLRLNALGDGNFELVQEDALPELVALSQSNSVYQNLTLNETPTLASATSLNTSGLPEADAQAISGLDWKVVTLQDEAEALQIYSIQRRNALILGGVILLGSILAAFGLARLISGPILRLNDVALKVSAGDLSASAKVETRDEVGTLATTFNSMVSQLRDIIGTLEQRVAASTRTLTLAGEVGRSVAQIHDLDVLLKEAVGLIREQFDLYYTQVYLLDPTGRQLILQAGTGEVGQQLQSRRHSLNVDLASLNGTAVVERHAVVIEDTETSLIHRPNPLLPETRSEMVIPLMIGDRVVGTLDIQSDRAGALNQENRSAFETLASQLAIAIDNAALLAETESARATVEAQSRRLIHGGWQEFLNAIQRGERIGYSYAMDDISAVTEPVTTESNGEEVLVTAVPVSNEPIGILKLEGEHTWSEDDTELASRVARQLGQQVENLRLLAQADQYRAEIENTLRRMTHQGWESELIAHKDANTGYSYDLNTVAPLDSIELNDPEPVLTYVLKIAGEKIGELSVAGTTSRQQEIDEILSTIGEQLSARVENLRLLEESERSQIEVGKRARQLAAVAEVSTVSSREMDAEKMLTSVVHLTQRQFGLYHAHIFLYDEKSDELRITACGWKEGDEHEGTSEKAFIPVSQDQSLVARAARSKQAVIANDVQNEPGWLPNPLLPDTASELAVPLIIGDQLIGVLDVQSDHPNAFSEEDANIQTTLASQVAIALQNARSFSLAQQQAEREAMLNVIGQKIRSATTVEAVLQVAARELGRALGAPLTVAQLGIKNGK